MFSLGFFEILALAVIALVVVGPEKLPGMARNIGRFLNEIKRTTNTISSEINAQMDEEKFFKEKSSQKNQQNKLDSESEHKDVDAQAQLEEEHPHD